MPVGCFWCITLHCNCRHLVIDQLLVFDHPYVFNHLRSNHEQCTSADPNGNDPSGAPGPAGYHPAWGDMGNDSGGECGLPTSLRFAAPTRSQTPGNNGVWWNAVAVGMAHLVTLTGELDLSPGSPQYQWLARHLATGVDRVATPWLFIGIHRPLYNNEAYADDYEVAQHLAEFLEPLLREHAVDAVLAGHYHSVLVTCPIAFGECADGVAKGTREPGSARTLLAKGSEAAVREVDARLREQRELNGHGAVEVIETR